MEHEKNGAMPEELVTRLRNALGEISIPETEAPGVYYLTVEGHGELYVVADTSPAISQFAKEYGKRLPGFLDLLFYPFEVEGSGSKVIAYELEKHHVAQNAPGHDCASLHMEAVYAAEQYPEYFGTYPAPILTPWGYTLRYRSIDNGIIWLETDQRREGLALCFPIWDAELSEETRLFGAMTAYDRENGIESTLGYLFFEKADACVPIFELLRTRPKWVKDGTIQADCLMNAIWQHHPEYVILHNSREQLGANDAFSQILAELGVETEPNVSLENMISFFPEAGSDFLQFFS